MKKYILLFFLLSLLPCLSTACSDDDGSSTPNLTVGKETVDFNSESGSPVSYTHLTLPTILLV